MGNLQMLSLVASARNLHRNIATPYWVGGSINALPQSVIRFNKPVIVPDTPVG